MVIEVIEWSIFVLVGDESESACRWSGAVMVNFFLAGDESESGRRWIG